MEAVFSNGLQEVDMAAWCAVGVMALDDVGRDGGLGRHSGYAPAMVTRVVKEGSGETVCEE